MTQANLIPKAHTLINKIIDFYFNQASSASGFLGLVLGIRFAILLILTINFGFVFSEFSQPGLEMLATWILWLYFAYTVVLLILAVLQADWFESYRIQVSQIIVDAMVIGYFYWLSTFSTGQPDSHVFLFYFLPLLVTARFLHLTAAVLLIVYISLASSLTWFIELNREQVFSWQYWFTDLLPQYGFLLILVFFYSIYYGRRSMSERLEKMNLALDATLSTLWRGWFRVDRNLEITDLDDAMHQRHGPLYPGVTCADTLCQSRLFASSEPCSKCPLHRVLATGEPARSTEVIFIDRYDVMYAAEVSARPVFDVSGKVIGATAWVQDLDEHKAFKQKQRTFAEHLERVIEQNRREDRARVQRLAKQLDALSSASQSALSSDLFKGVDEIIHVIALSLDCQMALVRQYQVHEETGQEGLVLCNHFGLERKDIGPMSVLDLDSADLIAHAFRTGQDQYIEDLHNFRNLRFEKIFRQYGLRSLACFPLKVQQRSIGTFTLFRNHRKGFSEEELHLGRALANIMATLVAGQLELARDHQEVQRRKRELDILSSLSKKLVTIEDPQLLAQLIADTVQNELRVETAAVFLRREDILCRFAISGIESSWFQEESYGIGNGVTGQAALPLPGETYGRILIENNVTQSDMVLPENVARYSERLGSRRVEHLLAVPLNGVEQTFGVLRVANKLTATGKIDSMGFTEHDAELMTTISCIAAVAMENTRLIELEKKKRLLEEALRQVAHKLSSSLEVGKILETILEQLRIVVRYDSASLFLQEPDGFHLRAMAGFSAEEGELLKHARLDVANVPLQRMQETLQPVLVHDLWQTPLLEPIIGTTRIRSWIGAPLIFKNEVLGWLSVDNWEPNQYSEEDAEIAQAFAEHAAIAINNARQYLLQREQVEFLMKLEQLLVDISSVKAKNATMDLVARAASQLMNCEMAGVALYDKEKKEIRAVPGAGYLGVSEDYIQNFYFPVDRRGGRVLREKRVFVSNDAFTDPQSIFGSRLTRPINAHGIIASPLVVGEHIVGVLYAASQSPRDWTDSQRALFSILGNHSAIAIRNSELLDARERRAQLLDLLHHLSIAGQLTNNPEVIYNVLLTAVTAEYGLRFNRALLLLYDNELSALKGFTAIGQLDNHEAYHVWESLDDRSHSFEAYIKDILERESPHYTALHYKAKNLEIPIRADSNEVFSRVFRTGRVVVVDPTADNEKINNEIYRIFDVNPFVVVPLLVNSEVVGMLVVDNKMTREPIRQMELELLESCASQAAAAVYRSRLHSQVEERIHVLVHLQELAQAFSELAEPREVLLRIVQATNDILRADIAYLVPYDPEKDELLVKESVITGAETSFRHEGTFSGHGLTSLAMQESSGLLVIEDLKSRKDLRSRFADQEGVRSVAVCRLEVHKKIVGMLYVNYRRSHWFTEFELNTLRMLAGQAAVAINNARLSLQNESLATQRERSRLREDLHDVLNTYAFKVMEPAESIFEKEKKKRRRDQGLVNEAEELWRFSQHTYRQLERILEDMRDPVLVERGLQEALRAQVISSKLPGVDLSINGETRPSADVELALYRICQEAISNIRKHAQLPPQGEGLVTISLQLDNEHSRLMIKDVGSGFSPEVNGERWKGMGLQAMHNWARKVGATIRIQSEPGLGTKITVVASSIQKDGRND